jgi:hypothetical protein
VKDNTGQDNNSNNNNIAVVSKYLLLFEGRITVLCSKSGGKAGTQFTMFSGGN